MAFSLRDQPDFDPGPGASGRDGVGGSNGRVGASTADRAHSGPLPDATFPELIGRLINDVSDLADRQIELAKQEVGEAKDQVVGIVVRIGIGIGIAAISALLLLIWAWTAFIWFFNWVGAFITIGSVTLAWLGWLVGLIVPPLLVFVAWRLFIRAGIARARHIWPPLPRTRATLKEDLAWVQHLRTRNAR